MVWKVELTGRTRKEIDKLDPEQARRILRFLRDSLHGAEDPRKRGKRLKGRNHELWRHRVGDYRLICALQDDSLLVLVVRVGHRREVYR